MCAVLWLDMNIWGEEANHFEALEASVQKRFKTCGS